MEERDLQTFTKQCGEFLNSYIPDFKRCFISGGFFPRFYHNLPIRDIDVYIDYDDDFTDIIKEYRNLPDWILEMTNRRHFRFREKSSNIRVDLIGFHNPRSPEWVNKFDFTICRGFYHKDLLSFQGTFDYMHLQKKELRFSGSCVHTTGDNHVLARLKKYLDLGFTIDDNQLKSIYQFLTGPDAKKNSMEDVSW